MPASLGTPASATFVALVGTIVLTGVSAGDALIVYTGWGDNSGTVSPTISDSVNGAWPAKLDRVDDTTGTQFTEQSLFPNSAAGATVTITVTFNTGNSFMTADAVGVTGVAAACLDKHASHFQSHPTTGTDVVTSGNVSPALQPALVVGFSNENTDNVAPAAGTGYTSAGSAFGFGGTSATLESKRITALTAVAATFTTSSATRSFGTLVMTLTEPGAVGPPATIVDTPRQVNAAGPLIQIRQGEALPALTTATLKKARPGEVNFQRVLPGPARSLAMTNVVLPAPHFPVPQKWPADWGYRTPAAPPARLVTRTDVLPAPHLPVPIAWAADWGYRTAAARSLAPVKQDVPLPAPMVLLKWPAPGPAMCSTASPLRVPQDVPLPAPALGAALTAWPGDRNTQSALPAPSRASQDVPIPRLSAAAVAPIVEAWPCTTPGKAPLCSPQDSVLHAVQVLSTWAPEGNTGRALSAPARVRQDSPLPAARVLCAWMPDNTGQTACRAVYTRAVQDLFTGSSEVKPWVPDVSFARPVTAQIVHGRETVGNGAARAWANDLYLQQSVRGPTSTYVGFFTAPGLVAILPIARPASGESYRTASSTRDRTTSEAPRVRVESGDRERTTSEAPRVRVLLGALRFRITR